jgi:dTDP-4-amino-4,6-dideoxygalactose transaminase/nucleoside-diphosphate-sugar epimerase
MQTTQPGTQRVLVTGGAGYIGSFVVDFLLKRGYEVVVLDNLIYGDKGLQTFKGRDKLCFIKGDITDPAMVERALQGVHSVIALAAIVGDPACQINEEITRRVNYESVKLLVDRSIALGVKRFVFASSCSVYGSNEHVKFLTEESELHPVSLYAITRIESEKYILERKHEMSSVILRLSTVFGRSPRMRFDLAINTMTARAVNTKAIDVFGGSQWRPFVHVQDVAKAFVVAMEADDRLVNGEVFNVGSTDSNYQIDDVAGLIADEVPGTVVTSNSTIVDMRNYNVIFDKIHKRLNYKVEFSVRDGIREVADLMREHKPDINAKEYSNFAVWKELGRVDVPIPYAVPDVSDDEKDEVIRAIDSGWLSTGPKTRQFEEEMKEYFEDADLEVMAVSSCTAALHLQLIAAGIGPGDEVITAPLTFCATVNTIMYAGATPVLVDVDPVTFNIDLAKVEAAITPRTKAIVPVYYAGQAVDHKRLRKIADKHKLLILADAAHAMGAKYDGKFCGTYEDAASFSFYATKNMVTGEGGAITTHDKDMAGRMRRLLQHGMNKDAWKRYSEAGSWYYEITDLGYKYNFTDVQAAFGIHQLKKLDHFNNVRRHYGEMYDAAFRDLPGVRLHGLDKRAHFTRHLYPFILDETVTGVGRQAFIDKLKAAKIGTSVHYVPIHHHSLYQRTMNVKPGDFPATDAIYKGLVSLPLYSKMTPSDVRRVIDIVHKTLEKSK